MFWFQHDTNVCYTPVCAGAVVDPAAAAVSAAADSLVGMMSDALNDITGEMGLVREQLVAACGDIDDAKQQLEAITAAPPAIPPGGWYIQPCCTAALLIVISLASVHLQVISFFWVVCCLHSEGQSLSSSLS